MEGSCRSSGSEHSSTLMFTAHSSLCSTKLPNLPSNNGYVFALIYCIRSDPCYKPFLEGLLSRPGIIVICNSNNNDYNCSGNSNRWNRMQCNSNRKQSNSN